MRSAVKAFSLSAALISALLLCVPSNASASCVGCMGLFPLYVPNYEALFDGSGSFHNSALFSLNLSHAPIAGKSRSGGFIGIFRISYSCVSKGDDIARFTYQPSAFFSGDRSREGYSLGYAISRGLIVGAPVGYYATLDTLRSNARKAQRGFVAGLAVDWIVFEYWSVTAGYEYRYDAVSSKSGGQSLSAGMRFMF